ncbi:GrpB family protein [Paenibacillus sp. EPM92]|uniref:GrpB family protein n=1 Tax=Paenibacillus sp. EPM92 TaxID=1561195 RepID=UPI0019165073|nr:GrpB family protein [Paenibacillus sp. EPM92]
MESVNFYCNHSVNDKAHQLFIEQRERIKQVVPDGDIQHAGSTAIPDTLTKGDLDIQVRVSQENFEKSVEALSRAFLCNEKCFLFLSKTILFYC